MLNKTAVVVFIKRFARWMNYMPTHLIDNIQSNFDRYSACAKTDIIEIKKPQFYIYVICHHKTNISFQSCVFTRRYTKHSRSNDITVGKVNLLLALLAPDN